MACDECTRTLQPQELLGKLVSAFTYRDTSCGELPAGCTLRTFPDSTKGARMIGHEYKLSRTNTGGVIWVCQCGAIGDVVPLVGCSEELSQRSRRRVLLTEGIARARHGEHLLEVREDIARRSEHYLTEVGHAIDSSNAILQRRGRWGHP